VSPNAGGWGGGAAGSQPMSTAVHIVNFGDLFTYLAYDGSPVEIIVDIKKEYMSAYHGG
jgi:hypothetical protein